MCSHCGKCVENCPVQALEYCEGKVVWHKERCVKCDTCIRICPENASPRIEYLSAREVMETVKSCLPFISGITVSGGECTLRAEFLTELFELAVKEGLDCLIDSNGTLDFSQERFARLIELSNGVMLDIKSFDNDIHKMVCGRSNEVILKNAIWLAERGKLAEVRTVCAASHLHNEQTVDEVSRMLAKYEPIRHVRYRIIKFRPFGVRKEYREMGTPSDKEMERLKKTALDNGLKDVIIT